MTRLMFYAAVSDDTGVTLKESLPYRADADAVAKNYLAAWACTNPTWEESNTWGELVGQYTNGDPNGLHSVAIWEYEDGGDSDYYYTRPWARWDRD